MTQEKQKVHKEINSTRQNRRDKSNSKVGQANKIKANQPKSQMPVINNSNQWATPTSKIKNSQAIIITTNNNNRVKKNQWTTPINKIKNSQTVIITTNNNSNTSIPTMINSNTNLTSTSKKMTSTNSEYNPRPSTKCNKNPIKKRISVKTTNST